MDIQNSLFSRYVSSNTRLSQSEMAALHEALDYKRSQVGTYVGMILAIVLILVVAAPFGWLIYKFYGWLLGISASLGRLALPLIAVLLLPVFLSIRSVLSPPSAHEELAKNLSLPVLYLRRSSQDGPATIKSISYNLDLKNVAQMEGGIEVEVGTVFRAWGPVIGLAGGRPVSGDWLGVSRLSGGHWQTNVLALMKISQAVLFIIGEVTEHILWELRKASAVVPLKRIVFVIPGGADPDAVEQYGQHIQEIFGRNLAVSRTYGETTYLAFDGRGFRPVSPVSRIAQYIPKLDNLEDQIAALENDYC